MLRKLFALTEQGAKDLKKGIIASVFTSLSLMLPMGLLLMLVMQLLQPLLGMETATPSLGAYAGMCLVLLVIIFLTHYIQYRCTYIAAYAESAQRRIGLAEKLRTLPLSFFGKRDLSDLTTTMMSDCNDLERVFAYTIPQIFGTAISCVIVCLCLFFMDWRMALAALITLPIGMLCYKGMANGYEEKFQGLIMRVRKMTSTVVEYIGGIEVIKAFNQSANSYQKYSDAVEDNASYAVNWMKSVQLYKSMLVTIWPSVLVCVLPIGCVLYRNGSLSVPAFVTCIVLSLGIITPILNAMNFTDSISQMKSVVGELCAVLDEKELDRPETPVSIHSSNIVLENVSFSYESEKPLLKNINLSIPENSITAFVGPSGGGKSTITKLIAGFWDVTNGTVKLDGIDIRKIPLSQLMDNIAYISQDNYLFDETVLENIRMGKPSATDEEVYQAARDCGCYDFILNLENGFQTVVGGAGGHLSGGERQRIAIARAVLKNAPIVILDEATAYIDAENEALIQEAMAKVIAGKTVLMIAHRLSTITDADKIVVVKDGQIIGEGTHENLLTSCMLYQEMWKAHMDTKDVA